MIFILKKTCQFSSLLAQNFVQTTSTLWKQQPHFTLTHFHVLAVTSYAKTHPQFPVPAITGCKKACEDNCLSYPTWKQFGSPIVLLLLRTNKPMRMDFLSIFLEDFMGPRKTVFVLKSRARKVQVIMACCRPNLQTSRVLFSFLKQTNYFFGT